MVLDPETDATKTALNDYYQLSGADLSNTTVEGLVLKIIQNID